MSGGAAGGLPGAAGLSHVDGKPAAGGRPAARWQVGAAWLTASAAAVGLANYGFGIWLVWALTPTAFAVASSAITLLLFFGTVASASVPWLLSGTVATTADGSDRRRHVLAFCSAATVLQAAVGVLLTCLAAARYADPATVAATSVSVLAIAASALGIGYLQGLQRFRLIAGLRGAEVAGKVGVSALLVHAGAGPVGVALGFAVGAVLVAGPAAVVGRRDLLLRLRGLRPGSLRDSALWSAMAGLLGIQGAVAVLSSLDIIVAGLLLADHDQLSPYQVVSVLARIPLFVSVALSMSVFARLAAATDPAERAGLIGSASRLLLLVVLPTAAVVATLPAAAVAHLFPPAYTGLGRLLAITTVAGVLLGVINLVTTFFQAAGFQSPGSQTPVSQAPGSRAWGRYGVCLRPLLIGLGGHGVLLTAGLLVAGVPGLAVGSCVGLAATTALVLRAAGRAWPGALNRAAALGVRVAALSVPLLALRSWPAAWLVWVGLLAVYTGRLLLAELGRGRPGGGRPRLLHLAFEDPRRPGAGGGSVRTEFINRALAARWQVTVVCARYPGCRSRVESGVRYVHVGRGPGRLPLLTYFASIPYALLRWPSELVVEDFAAPLSSVAVPWLTRRPTVGVVQWLFARQKARQYRLPFHLVEALGVRSHRRLVAVSDDLAAELRSRNHRATVVTVANGVDTSGWTAPVDRDRRHIVYLGRLEIAQKGLDLLLDAFAGLPDPQLRLLLGGDGPDEAALRARAQALGLTDRVSFLGRVPAERRFDLLAGAAVLAMPSRYETFGMVAAEALAAATPVVAFDIPCLRALVGPANGIRVPVGDIAGLTAALAGLLADPERARALGRAGPAAVAHLRWDVLARQQEEVYRTALRLAGVRGRHRRRSAGVAATVRAPAAPVLPGTVRVGTVRVGTVPAGATAGRVPVSVQSTVVSEGVGV
jgi:glycosyltransferase involved in cell wall biosynthesis/O-antigen/teichoic acid export membrane protein